MHKFGRASFTRAFTLVFLGGLALGLAACSPSSTAGGSAADDPQVRRGKTLFNGTCASCHATTDDDVIVGPSLAGIAERAGGRIPGTDSESYMRQSILDPRAFIVEGFPNNLMPTSYGQAFTAEDIDAILAYLHTLKK